MILTYTTDKNEVMRLEIPATFEADVALEIIELMKKAIIEHANGGSGEIRRTDNRVAR